MKSKFIKLAALGLTAALTAAVTVPLAGCIPGVRTDYSQKILNVSTDSQNRLYWRNKVNLVCNIGYETSTDTAISFTDRNTLTPKADSSVILPDGKEYRQGDLKPAWQALEDQLRVTLTDSYVPLKSDASIENLICEEDDERLYRDENGNLVSDERDCLWDFDIITGSCAAIQTMQASSDEAKFLDLSLYLDYMPNYKAFLEDNPIIYLSLTTDTATGAMYYAPYFDGNDDIEKYTLVQKSWARKLLDSDDFEDKSSDTFAEQAESKNKTDNSISTKSGQAGDNVVIDGTKSSVESFMGQTGSWQIDVIAPNDNRMTRTVKVTVDYDSALKSAKSGVLNEDILAATAVDGGEGVAYTGTSGNIVDIQNFVINQTQGKVKGTDLLKILRDYIDVTYLTRDGKPFYSQDGVKRSDIFCGATAAWDVDLLAAMSRCVVTCLNVLGDSISDMQGVSDLFAFGGRSSFTQRIADMYAFAGELYGVRGLESRYEFTYIDENGDIKDARENAETWDALNRLSAFAKEGLMYTGDVSGTDRSIYTTTAANRGPVYFLEHDYVQTQTLYQMRLDPDIPLQSYQIPEDYEFSPIITAVSHWNDGSSKIMRFTESWRSVKNTGFCIPYQSVSNNPEKLSAVLAFIDFFFSKDGQILMSYGPQSQSNENPDGWWYAEEIPDADLTDDIKFRKISDATTYLSAQYESTDGSCFVYNGKVYEGLEYSGRSIPIMTDDNLNCFKGKTFGNGNTIAAYTLNYTNYARKVIGSALPIGNKDQGFEFQCTAKCGLDGASIVDAALNKAGIIKHVTQKIDDNEQNNLWYVIVPTLLPLSAEASDELTTDNQKAINAMFQNSSSAARNSFVRLMYNGYSNGTIDGTAAMPADADGVLQILSELGMATRTLNVDTAWHNLYDYYEANIKQSAVY